MMKKIMRYAGKISDILDIIIIPVSAFIMAIAVILFFVGLFHKIHPQFSIILALIALLYGLYGFLWAYWRSKILLESKKEKWYDWDFNFSFKAGIVSILIAIVTFVFATLKDVSLYKDSLILLSVILFILGFGMLFLGLNFRIFGFYGLDYFKILCEFIVHPEERFYLFSWENIPGDDSEELIEYLKDDLNIGWAEKANISKSDDGTIIHIFKDDNSADIKIDEKNEKATLKISDDQTYELKVKKEKGNLKIYETFNPWSDAKYLGLTLGLCIVGLLYVAFFLPLTLWSSSTQGLDFIDVLLFAHLKEVSAGLGILGRVEILVNFSNTSDLFAFGVFYGTVALINTLMRLSLTKHKKIDIAIMSNGLVYGYALTIWVKYLFGPPISSSLLFSAMLDLSYVLFLYFGLMCLVDVISRWGIRAKFDYLIGGIQAIGTAWILSRVFGDQAIVFVGVTYFICTFIATSIFEATFGQIIQRRYFILQERAEPIIPAVLALLRERNPQFRSSVLGTIVIGSIFPFIVFIVLKLAIMFL